MKEEAMRTELKTFEGLIRVLKALESRLTEYQKLLEGRWFESIKALALLDERLTDLEDRVTENGG